MRCGWQAAALGVAALCAVGACRRDQAPAAAGPPPAAAGAAGDAGARLALTRDEVDRFVRYQSRLVELYDQVLKQREKKVESITHLADGGVADPVKVSLQLFQGKARAEEAARGEAGLSAEDVRRIEPIVAEVINERSNARDEDVEGAVKQYEAVLAKLPEEQRKPMEEQVQELKADHAQRFGNVEQREKYGDAAVDAVLGREAELTRLRAEWVKRIAALSH